MADNQTDPDFRSIINAAAAKWYSQRSTSPDHTQASHNDRSASPTHATGGGEREVNDPGSLSGLTAWQGVLQTLPEESKDILLPIHPLAQALSEQPSLRPAEWNPYRQQGGFKPRTAIDYSSLMIYLSGQVNPNPCRNCRLKNGPYAHCVVAPPPVLGLSSLKHACANCTYQNQHKKCTNLPIDDEELVAKSRIARSSMKLKNPTPMKPPGRRPKLVSENNLNSRARYKPDYGHMIRKPTAQSISAEAFGDKLRLIRSWSPRSRRRMKAEVKQWEAALMTIEAENARDSPRDHILDEQGVNGTPSLPDSRLPTSQTPTHATATPSVFPPSVPPVQGSLAEVEAIEAEIYDEYSPEQMDEDEDENAESDYEGTSWVGFNDPGLVMKPPL
ncbi:uncharacterized protein GGS22DRAFT_82321 [Annulohypoxylon maeteangense]|uniref:uncharacterized protein n=1 Tax=Annulohypoxylon maeteangense TaxID=1927788 RepID=UPI0020073A16|nr:uncharacterized protein GGS22DRAFT_82321 [Annulohypoxylon maeteangense]KAI0880714.1 hypothetical protein GGS22DRAFT_82321 [Annulohypoxylon maeteangense]